MILNLLSAIPPSPGGDHGSSSSGGELVSSPDSFKRVVDGCEMVAVVAHGECLTGIYSPDIHRTASLPRGWHRLNRHDGLDTGVEYRNLGVTTSTPCSPRSTLDRRGSNGKQGFFSHKKGGIPPLPPVRKSSLDQRNRAASPLHQLSHSLLGSSADDAGISGPAGFSRERGSSIDSSRLFSAKLEQLANRTNSLGRVHSSHSGSHHYDCFSLERGGSLRGGGGGVRGDSTMPRTGRSLTRAGSVSSPTGNTSSSASASSGPSSAPQSPAKSSGQSKISAVSKLLMTSSPKSRSLSASSTKTLSFSTKSLSQTGSRSSSLPPNGKVGSNIYPPWILTKVLGKYFEFLRCSVSPFTRLSHASVSSAPELSPEPSAAAAAAAGTFPWILVYPVFESQSRGKPGCQTASPGCKQSDLRAPPGKCRLPFQGSCPGRGHWSRRGERSWRGKVGEFYFIVF